MDNKFDFSMHKENLIIFIITLFFCEICLITYFPMISYFDEIVVLFFLGLLFVKWTKSRIDKSDLTYLSLILMLVIFGLFFNFKYNIQSSKSAIFLDVFSVVKYFIFALSVKNCVDDVNKKYIIINLAKLFTLISFLIFIFAILNLFTEFGMGDTARYGVKSFKFICENAGQFNYCCYFLIVIFTANYFINKKSLIPLLISLLLAISTLRSRTFIFVIMYLFLFLYFSKTKKERPWAFVIILLISIPLFIYMSYGQFDNYFNNDESARSRLLTTSFKIFANYFPFGTGFGTYGTAAAASYYSQLYYDYHLDVVWGLYPSNPAFASDNYWPSIIAQFGIVGIALIIFLIYYSFKFFDKKIVNRKEKVCLYFVYIILITSSLVTASFYHYSSIGLLLILSVISSTSRGEKLYE